MSRSFCSFVIFLYCQSQLVWPKNCVASASENQSCTVAGFTSECLAQYPATPAKRGPSDATGAEEENGGTAHGILPSHKVVLVPPETPPPKFVVDHKVPLEHQTGYFGIWGGTPHDATTHPTNYHDDDDECFLMSTANPKQMTRPRTYSPKQEYSSSYKPSASKF